VNSAGIMGDHLLVNPKQSTGRPASLIACGPLLLAAASADQEFLRSRNLAEHHGCMTAVGKQRSLHSRLLQSVQDAQRAQLTWLEPFPFNVDGPFQQLVGGRMQSGV
jgi:hypothetical protein